MSKIISFKQNVNDDFKKFREALTKNDFVSACMLFNRLIDSNKPEVFLYGAVMYSLLKRPIHEIFCLIKLITFENFSEFNIDYTARAIALFFKQTQNVDLEDYYKSILEKRARKTGQIISKTEKKLEFVDKIQARDRIVKVNSLIMRGDYDSVSNEIKNAKPDDDNYDRLKVMEAYSYRFMDKNEDIRKMIIETNEKYPEKTDLILQLLSIYTDESGEFNDLRESLIKKKSGISYALYNIDKLMAEKKYEELLVFANNLKESDRLNEKVILSQISASYLISDMDGVIKYLKQYFFVERNSMFKRYIRILQRENVNIEGDLFAFLNRIAIAEINAELNNALEYEQETFNKLPLDHVSDLLDYCLSLKNSNKLVKLVNMLAFRVDTFNLLEDVLIDPVLNDGAKYAILVTLINCVYREKVNVVFGGKLITQKLKYPSCILDEFSFEDEDGGLLNMKLYRMAYAEVFVYYLYNNLELTSIEKTGDKIYKKIQSLPPDYRETFSKVNVLSAIIASFNYLDNDEILKMIAEDFEITTRALYNLLRILELKD